MKQRLGRTLFDGTKVPGYIHEDPMLFCGYRPRGNPRCGRPTLEIIAYDETRGATWLPICASCWSLAEYEQGIGFQRHSRLDDKQY